MAREPGIHWEAPLYMLGALISGVLLAIAHHCFYSQLNGGEVSAALINSFISAQQTNIAVGTALAFLVKACLVFAVCIALIQNFWYAVRIGQHSRSRLLTLHDIDGIYSTPSNLLAVLNIRLWYRNPSLLLMALLTWLIPIASIITPSTLSIHAAVVMPAPTSLLRVPNVDFKTFNLLSPLTTRMGSIEDLYYNYAGPSRAVKTIAAAALANGAILPIAPPASNASWELSFPGPIFRCDLMDDDHKGLVESNIRAGASSPAFREQLFSYISWAQYEISFHDARTPMNISFTKSTLPFQRVYDLRNNGSISADSYVLSDSQAVNFNANFNNGEPLILNGNANNGVPLILYMFVLPNASNTSKIGDGSYYEAIFPAFFKNASFLQCKLFNTTYVVNFEYINGVQNISVSTGDASLLDVVRRVDSIDGALWDPTSYVPPCDVAAVDCYMNPELLQTLSYQALFDAFTQYTRGSISTHKPRGLINDYFAIFTEDTHILETPLGRTTELAAAYFDSLHLKNSTGLSTTDSATLPLSLQRAIEQLFQNLTVSAISSAALQPNYTSITAPAPVKVTFHRYRNVYVYNAWGLWAAYGSVILLSSFAVLGGVISIALNKACYSNTFSTIFRASRSAKTGVAIKPVDLDGRDPLPAYLSKAELYFNELVHQDAKKGKLVASASFLKSEEPSTRSGLLVSTDDMDEQSRPPSIRAPE